MTISQYLLPIPVNRENCSDIMKTRETNKVPLNGDAFLDSNKPLRLDVII
jgi:hypothetical protein